MHPLENRLRILERLRHQDAMSRTELTHHIGLSPATVSGIVKDLVAHDLLRETRIASEMRGRPRVALTLNPSAMPIAGAFVQVGGRIDLQIGDMAGTVLTHASIQPEDPVTVPHLIDAIAQAFAQATNGLPDRPAAMGVSLPAMIDGHRGHVHWLPPGGPRSEDFAQSLGERIGIPVFIDNVGNIMALAERWFGNEAFNDNLCVVAVGVGIALGQFTDGMIHRGAHGINPEIGHTKTGIGHDMPCSCGARGCLVQVAPLSAIGRRAVEQGMWQGDPITQFMPGMDIVATLAEQGDERALAILSDAGAALGIALANHIASWDPSKVLVVAESPAWARTVYPIVLRTIGEALPLPMRDMIGIEIRPAQPDLLTRGTLALALDHIFRTPELSGWTGKARGSTP